MAILSEVEVRKILAKYEATLQEAERLAEDSKKEEWKKVRGHRYAYPNEIIKCLAETCLHHMAENRRQTEALAKCRCWSPRVIGTGERVDCGECCTCLARIAVAKEKEKEQGHDKERDKAND
ncbi:MAG: hypothetical protein Q8Q12_00655 [bacterium]|nr:hypothetical protein [bacterium]